MNPRPLHSIGRRLALTLVAGAALLAGGQAGAQDAPAGRAGERMAELKKRFAAADADRDGKLTRAEAEAGMPIVAKHFDVIDAGKTGAVTLRDIVAFVQARRGANASGG